MLHRCGAVVASSKKYDGINRVLRLRQLLMMNWGGVEVIIFAFSSYNLLYRKVGFVQHQTPRSIGPPALEEIERPSTLPRSTMPSSSFS